MNTSVASFIFNEDESQILLVKRRDVPVWVIPGGGVDPFESEEKAALREAKEETGFDLELLSKIGEYLPKNRLTRHTFAFKFKIIGGKPELSSEVQDIAFFPVDSLPYHLPPPYPDWIEDAKGFRKPFVKVIESVTYMTFFKFLIKHPVLVARFLLSRCGLSINTLSKHKPASK